MTREDVSFKGLGDKRYTYKAHVSITASDVNKAVTLTASETAGLGSSGDFLLGQLKTYETDGRVGVQTEGYATFDGVSGSLPSKGECVVVNGSGKVIAMPVVSAGASYLRTNSVISTDASTFKVVVLLS